MRSRRSPRCRVVRVGSRLDGGTVARLRPRLHEAVDSSDGDVIVDLSGLEMIDAAGLGSSSARIGVMAAKRARASISAVFTPRTRSKRASSSRCFANATAPLSSSSSARRRGSRRSTSGRASSHSVSARCQARQSFSSAAHSARACAIWASSAVRSAAELTNASFSRTKARAASRASARRPARPA